MARFSVVICHGLYHTPAPYQPLIEALAEHGIETYCPQLPTSDLSKLNVGDVHNPDFDRPPPEGGYPDAKDDAAVVGHVVDRLLAESKSVVLLGHSAGGFVAAEAATPARQAPARAAAGQTGGVVGIFFAGAFVIPPGESVTSFFQPKEGEVVAAPFMRFHVGLVPVKGDANVRIDFRQKYGPEGLGTVFEPARFLFNDVDAATAEKWAATLTAGPILKSPLTHDPYANLPCTYLVLEKDMTLPMEYQEGMVAGHNAKCERQIALLRAPCGHAPHLSWTKGLRDAIEAFGRQLIA